MTLPQSQHDPIPGGFLLQASKLDETSTLPPIRERSESFIRSGTLPGFLPRLTTLEPPTHTTLIAPAEQPFAKEFPGCLGHLSAMDEGQTCSCRIIPMDKSLRQPHSPPSLPSFKFMFGHIDTSVFAEPYKETIDQTVETDQMEIGENYSNMVETHSEEKCNETKLLPAPFEEKVSLSKGIRKKTIQHTERQGMLIRKQLLLNRRRKRKEKTKDLSRDSIPSEETTLISEQPLQPPYDTETILDQSSSNNMLSSVSLEDKLQSNTSPLKSPKPKHVIPRALYEMLDEDITIPPVKLSADDMEDLDDHPILLVDRWHKLDQQCSKTNAFLVKRSHLSTARSARLREEVAATGVNMAMK